MGKTDNCVMKAGGLQSAAERKALPVGTKRKDMQARPGYPPSAVTSGIFRWGGGVTSQEPFVLPTITPARPKMETRTA